MNSPHDKQYFLVDIDGTLTDYRPGVFEPEKLLHHNFLFPIIRDMMVEKGWDYAAAGEAIGAFMNRNVYWDYPDFIAEFELSAVEAFRRMRAWHRENLFACTDGVALVKELRAAGKTLFVMSNNPYVGCVLKLQVAGLADNDFSSPYFARIFGTNVLRGCKCDLAVWRMAMAQIPADPSEICVIGDNPGDDAELPASVGIESHIILERTKIAHGVETTERN